ncbi:hypothetical protein D3C78_1897740 [compost metagenome]
MNDGNTKVTCRLCDGPCSIPINGKSDVRLAFCLVDSGVGSSRYHSVGLYLSQRF